MLAKTTSSSDEFISATGELLESDPVGNSIILTMLAGLRYRPPAAPAITWSWVSEQGEDGERVVGASAFSAPYLVVLSGMPAEAAAALADALAAGPDPVPGVIGEDVAAAAFARQWSRATGRPAAEGRRELVLQLDADTVVADREAPSGHSRPAVLEELELLTDWCLEAAHGSRLTRQDAARTVQQQIAAGRLQVWEDDGPVAILGRSAAVSGAGRYGPVYTRPERRGKGYVRALLIEAAQGRHEQQAPVVAAYVDLGNQAVQKLFTSIGFRPSLTMAEYRFD